MTQDIASSLADQFRQDFGLKRPELRTIGPVKVGDREWTFEITAIHGQRDQVWIATHARIYTPRTLDEQGSASVATDMEITAASAVLCIRSVNGTPLWALMRQLDRLPLREADLTRITDPLWPPTEIHYAAATAFLELVNQHGAFNRDILGWVAERLEEFPTTFRVPAVEQPARYPFKCANSECSFVITLDGAEVDALRERLTEKQSVICPRCGGDALPPKNEGMDNADSPLRVRFGRR